MSTVKTTISRHIDHTDVVIFVKGVPHQFGNAETLLKAAADLAEEADVAVATPYLIRCADTHDVIEIGISNSAFAADTYRDCDRLHWRLVHCVVETGQEISA